jgi:16S rRNA (guanine527-N7)-methyltransferase
LEFQALLNVSRETLAAFETYAGLLTRWQKAINLVGRKTLEQVWLRHFYDSAQLLSLAPEGAKVWIDLGSGAGFPGLVLALLGAADVHLIESDGRKTVFLEEAARVLDLPVTVHRGRIESLAGLPRPDVITARALAPLAKLMDYGARLAGPKTIGLFLKGQDFEKELTEAGKSRTLALERIASQSGPSGVILRVKRFGHA